MRFDETWQTLIDLCVEHLPWEVVVDFEAREWPVMHACKRPDAMGQADFVRLNAETKTVFRVSLGARRVQITVSPSSETLKCVGQLLVRGQWVDTQRFSPDANGKIFRGGSNLAPLAIESFTWLSGGSNA